MHWHACCGMHSQLHTHAHAQAPLNAYPAPRTALPSRCCQCASGHVVARLEGQPIMQHADGSYVVPLLLPDAHQLPFGMAVQIHDELPSLTAAPYASSSIDSSPAASSTSSGSSASTSSSDGGEEGEAPLVTLAYVLSGRGQLLLPTGECEQLLPGDSFIQLNPTAGRVLGAGASSSSASAATSSHHDSSSATQAPAAGGTAAGPQSHFEPLVTLQLLLPRCLLQTTLDQPTCRTAAETGKCSCPWLGGGVLLSSDEVLTHLGMAAHAAGASPAPQVPARLPTHACQLAFG